MSRTITRSAQLTTSDRFGAATGAAYVLLILIGNQLAAGSSTDPHPSGAKDLAGLTTAPSVVERIGFTMEFVGVLAFMFFIGWLVNALRARGAAAAWLAGAAGIAGATTVAVKIASVMPMAAGRLDHASLSPSTARLLTDMNSAGFVVTFLTFGTFLLASGLAILSSGFLGRFAGWAAVVLGGLAIVLTLLTGVNPVNTNPMPFLAGLLWVLVVSIRLAWIGPRDLAVAPVDAQVAVPA